MFGFGDQTQVPSPGKYPEEEPIDNNSLKSNKKIEIPKNKDLAILSFERSKRLFTNEDDDYSNEWVSLAGIYLKDAAGKSLGSLKTQFKPDLEVVEFRFR